MATSKTSNNSMTTATLNSAQIMEAARGEPLKDEERAVIEIDVVREEMETLNDMLDEREVNGKGRTLPDPSWLSKHTPLLQRQYDLLIPRLLESKDAIFMARKMLRLFEARQNGQISGNHQDLEFGRINAKMHFPEQFHAKIDQEANKEISKTMEPESAIHTMSFK